MWVDRYYERLTFALLSVCAPQDLIQDKRRTPFNIGQAIELSGFSYEEAITLAKGLPGGEEMLREVLDWTGGQPFLTQRVCRLVTEMRPPNPQFWGDMSVEEVVRERIIRVWESQDEQVHFQTIGDRMMADESLAGAMLGMYQRVLTDGGVGIDGSAEQIALRLTGAVVKWGDRICVANRIYEGVFGREWVAAKLAALRPYGEELGKWVVAGNAEWLLRGDALRKARVWAEEKDRKLAPEDYRFLQASQDLETQIELQVVNQKVVLGQEARTVLEASKRRLEIANRKASRRVMFGTALLAGSFLIAGVAGMLWNMADIRILSMTVKDDYARENIQSALLNSMKAYQRLRSWTVFSTLNVEPYQGTESSVMNALQTSIYGNSRNTGSFVDPELKTGMRSHVSSVRSVAWSPDGEILASGSGDSFVKLWRRDGSLITILKGHNGPVRSVAWSPDGQTLASSSDVKKKSSDVEKRIYGEGTSSSGQLDDYAVKLWRRDGSLITTLKGHEGSVNSVAWNPDGKVLASGSDDSTVKIWKRDGSLITTLKGHENSISSIAWSPDGQTIASGSGDKTIRLWLRTGALMTTVSREHRDTVRSIAWSPDGQTIASGSDDKTIKLWKRDGTFSATIRGHMSPVNTIAWSPDGQTIASGSEDKTVKLWRRTGTLITTLKGHGSTINSIAWSSDGETIASGSDDKTVKIWWRDGFLLTTLRGHESYIWRVVWSPDRHTLASSSDDKTIKLWRYDGSLITTLRGHKSAVSSISWSPNGEILASGSDDKTIKLWKRDGTLIRTIEGHKSYVSSIAWSPDGQTLVSGSADGTAKLWGIDGSLVTTLEGHKSSVSSVAWSPDGQTLASGSADNSIRLWHRNGSLITSLKGHENYITSIAWSPDGQTLASGSGDNTIKLWRLNGSLITTLRGHQRYVASVDWSPDGQTLASGSADETIKLWRRDGSLTTTLKNDSGSVWSVAWSPDGETIASGNYDKTVKLWTWKSSDLFAMGCYWLKDGFFAENPDLQKACEEPETQKVIPRLLISQANATANLGNYKAAEELIREAKRREPSIDINPALTAARIYASRFLLEESTRSSSLEGANFLVRRAKSINPELNLEQEMKRVRDKWKASVDELRIKK